MFDFLPTMRALWVGLCPELTAAGACRQIFGDLVEQVFCELIVTEFPAVFFSEKDVGTRVAVKVRSEVSHAAIMVKLDNAVAMRTVRAFTRFTFDDFEFHDLSVLPEVFLENYLPCIMAS